jgi:hypothetical protein
MKMREKEAEMRSFFEVPRPAEIDFSDIPRDARPIMRLKARPDARSGPTGDNDDNNDSPLAADGDDMEKLIAERIASRQRDLEEITERIKTTMPPPPTATTSTVTEYNPNDVIPREDVAPMPTLMPSMETRKVRFQEDTTPIFLKLKRKPLTDGD